MIKILTTISILIFTVSLALADVTMEQRQHEIFPPVEWRVEYPNLFLNVRDRKNPEKAPEVEVTRTLRLLNSALSSIFERMTVAVIKDSKPKVVRIFKYLDAELQKKFPDVKMRIGGSLVREAIALIYQRALEEHRASVHFDRDEFLSKIANEKGDIPYSKLTGVDVVFQNSMNVDVLLTGPKVDVDEAKKVLFELANSVRLYLGHGHRLNQIEFNTDPNKTIQRYDNYPKFNILDYVDHMDEMDVEGGSTIDALAFDYSLGAIIESPYSPGTVSQMIRGLRQFVRPKKNAKNYTAKTVISAMKPAMQLPFLRLEENSQKILNIELNKLLRTMKWAEGSYERAQEFAPVKKVIGGELTKIFLSPVNTAQNDVLFRSPSDSTEAVFVELVKTFDAALLTPILESYPIPQFNGRDTKSLPIELLYPNRDFFSLTADGFVFHGTDLQSILGISVKSFFMSNNTNNAHEGFGVYTTLEKNMARNWGSALLPIQIRKDKKINILRLQYGYPGGSHFKYWHREIQPDFLRNLEQALRLDFNENLFWVLARDYGIDIVYYEDLEYVLILNREAIVQPSLETVAATLLVELKKAKSKAESKKIITSLMKILKLQERAGINTEATETKLAEIIAQKKESEIVDPCKALQRIW